jgi:hypothetical protein
MTRTMIERQIALANAALDRATTPSQTQNLKETIRDLEVMLSNLR